MLEEKYALPTTTSVTLVEFFSCLISCFFLSNSPFPSRSLMVSLYYDGSARNQTKLNKTHDFEELTFYLVFPSLTFHILGHSEDGFDSARDHARRVFGLD